MKRWMVSVMLLMWCGGTGAATGKEALVEQLRDGVTQYKVMLAQRDGQIAALERYKKLPPLEKLLSKTKERSGAGLVEAIRRQKTRGKK